MNDEGTGRVRLGAQKNWEWVSRLFMLITTLLLSYGLKSTLDNGKKVAALEASHAGLRGEVADVKLTMELAGARLSELTTAVAVIEGNRFKAEDGKELWQAVAERPRRDDVVSPSLFLQSVDSLEGRLDRIEEKLP